MEYTTGQQIAMAIIVVFVWIVCTQLLFGLWAWSNNQQLLNKKLKREVQ